MILASHNSWSYLSPKKWWMKPLAFTAKCQDVPITVQYEKYNVRCFDLRVRFKHNKLVVVHGFIEYNITEDTLYKQLEYLNSKKDVYVRIIHDVRTKKQYKLSSSLQFDVTCFKLKNSYPNITFWCGRNLYNWNEDYYFDYHPKVIERYSSVCKPFIDDLYPKYYAKKNNKKLLQEYKNVEMLMIDFVNLT